MLSNISLDIKDGFEIPLNDPHRLFYINPALTFPGMKDNFFE